MKRPTGHQRVAGALRLPALAVVALILPACGASDGSPGSADAWSRLGNAGTVDGTNFLGTTDLVALDIRVNNTRAFRVEPTPGTPTNIPNIVGGFSGNNVAAGVEGSFIGGGGSAGNENRVLDRFGVVGGGSWNQAGDGAGGFCTVGGGFNNIASGICAVVPGGNENWARGDFSFAAGRRARALNTGCFIWADMSGAGTLDTTAGNQFIARASGGVTFWSNSAATLGATLAPNATAWAAASDREMKTDIVPVDGRVTLEKVAAMPISTWRYKDGDPSVRSMGPMAQDFRAAFELGWDDKHITTVDADGVALSAIQGLYALMKEKDAKIEALQSENAEIKARLAAIERALLERSK